VIRLPRLALWACKLALCMNMAMWPGLALPATSIDLYSETVEVQGKDYQARLNGYKQALAQVLVRTTGRRDIAAEPALAGVLDDANRLVLQYQFLEDGRLLVSFDGDAIEQLLARHGLPLWSRERPRTLVWLAMDNGAGARTLVGGEQAVQARDFLQELAQQRGLPLIFPIMDGVDMAAVPFSEIWGGFNDEVMEASNRYQPDAVLIGRALRDGTGRWAVRWNLQFAGQVVEFAGAIEDGVQVSADWFARQFSVTPGSGPGLVRVIVSGIDGIDQYAKVQEYLGGLSMVDRVDVLQAGAQSMVFSLSLRSGMEVLHKAMALNRMLVEIPETQLGSHAPETLYYRVSQ
jgi:hypothetical protein